MTDDYGRVADRGKDRPIGANDIARTALQTIDPKQRVRVTRTVTYEGPAEWVKTTLDHSALTGIGRCAVVPRGDVALNCTHEEIETLD